MIRFLLAELNAISTKSEPLACTFGHFKEPAAECAKVESYRTYYGIKTERAFQALHREI
jgi:hypothetical protein